VNVASGSYTSAEAESMIKVSALIVGAIYLYRRFTEPSSEELLRQLPQLQPQGPLRKPSPQLRRFAEGKQMVPLGSFLLGWGFLYLSLSAVAPSWPGFAGNTALMVLVASLLANGVAVSRDLQSGLQTPVAERGKRRRRGRAPPPGTSAGKLPNTNEEGLV
jgi:hypothetical protein